MPTMISELALEVGMDRSSLRKWLIRNGFEFVRVSGPKTRGAAALALSIEDAEKVREMRKEWVEAKDTRPSGTNGETGGFFYIIQIIPEFAPNRIKLGFATNPEFRLQDHRCAAPTAQIVKIWPCRFTWERAAIASITRRGCTPIGFEVFDCDDLPSLVERAQAFFALMP